MKAVASEALEQMRAKGGQWAAYENHDLGHYDLGRMVFIAHGPDCTLAIPPRPTAPDMPAIGPGWRYVYIGEVNLTTGVVDEEVHA